MGTAVRLMACLVAVLTLIAACAGAPANPGSESARTERAKTATDAPNPFPGTTQRKAKNGEILYCWREARTGRRIPTEQCATETVMRKRSESARQVLDDIRDPAGRGGCNPSVASC